MGNNICGDGFLFGGDLEVYFSGSVGPGNKVYGFGFVLLVLALGGVECTFISVYSQKGKIDIKKQGGERIRKKQRKMGEIHYLFFAFQNFLGR